MKKQLYFLAAVLFLFSCGHSKPTKEMVKLDTILVVAQGVQGPFFDSAIRAIGRTRGFKDSGLQGTMIEYTAFRLGQLTDTVRDNAGHPKRDSVGRYIMKLAYPAAFTDTNLNKYIIPIVFPKPTINK